MRILAKSAFLLLLLVATATRTWAADGRILSYEGDVRVNGQPVTAQTILNSQDTITTAENASARLVLSDNSVLDLDSGTEILLSDYGFEPSSPAEGTSDIDVVEGSLRYVSGLIAKENPDNIRFSAGGATIGVRGSFTGIDVDGVVVNVESMIGEAVLIRDTEDGQTNTLVVPTGQATTTDAATGETSVVESEASNQVNEVVRAIAAISPDAQAGSMAEGCSRGNSPIRASANPDYGPEEQANIQAMLKELSEGELMMVIAVLNNNARHLCIDYTAVDSAISEIATVRPEAAADVLFVAALVDPDNADQFAETAIEAAPSQGDSIKQASDAANSARDEFDTGTAPPTQGSDDSSTPEEETPSDPEQPADSNPEVPPGGSPSPE